MVRMQLVTAGPSEVNPKNDMATDYYESWWLQEERLYKFLQFLIDKAEDDWSHYEFDVMIFSEAIDEVEIGDVIENDEELRLLSIILAFLYLYKYTGSLFLSFIFILASFLSFNPITLMYVGIA